MTDFELVFFITLSFIGGFFSGLISMKEAGRIKYRFRRKAEAKENDSL